MFAPAYFDHNATAPLAPGVLEGMLPFLDAQYGNPSSRHEYGRAARRAIDEARQRVAYAVGAHPTEVIFTSGGTEASNLLIKGAAAELAPGMLAISGIEHPCVREPARQLLQAGWSLREFDVDGNGRILDASYRSVIAMTPRLVSIMLANNETGVIQDIARLAEAAKPARAIFHSDAVQAFGRMAVNFRDLNRAGVHAITLSAHKLGGPKGAGALVVDKRVELRAQVAGGGHERGLRSGTENVAAIAGFGLAAEFAVAQLETRAGTMSALRSQLESGLVAQGATLFSGDAARLPNTSFFAFDGIDGETLVGRLDRAGFALAAGAACSSANPEPSHVLLAMGIEPALARGAVRASFGNNNTAVQVENFLAALQTTIAQLRGLTALAN